MTSSGNSASQTADWPLRALLLVALSTLILTAVLVAVVTSPTGTLAGAPLRARHHPHPIVPTITTATTVPGAVSGASTRVHVGGGCGFSLRGMTTPEPVGHCTVVEIGDSLGNDLGWGISRHVTKTSGLDLVQLDESSTGLSNSWFYNWHTHLAAILQHFHPKLVLICLGGNDEQGMEINGSAVPFATAAWKTAYVSLVRHLIHEATASGAYVLWIGMPIMQQSSYNQGMETLNALFQAGVTSEPNATLVPTWSLFSNHEGAFQSQAEVNGAQTTLRESDGIHYSFDGENVVATYVIREIALIYHVKLAPTDPAVISGWA